MLLTFLDQPSLIYIALIIQGAGIIEAMDACVGSACPIIFINFKAGIFFLHSDLSLNYSLLLSLYHCSNYLSIAIIPYILKNLNHFFPFFRRQNTCKILKLERPRKFWQKGCKTFKIRV